LLNLLTETTDNQRDDTLKLERADLLLAQKVRKVLWILQGDSACVVDEGEYFRVEASRIGEERIR